VFSGVNLGVENNTIEAYGQSYYVNAVKEPWRKNFQMYSYVNEELPSIIQENFNVNKDKQSIMGHRCVYKLFMFIYYGTLIKKEIRRILLLII